MVTHLTDGMFGVIKQMFEYGIQTEKSTQRAHVCVYAGLLYTYKTEYGVAAINTGRYKLKAAKQPGYDGITAKGFAVPVWDILGLKTRRIPKKLLQLFCITDNDSTSEKGRKSVAIVSKMMLNGLFPFFVSPIEVTGHSLQISGTDIFVRGDHHVQVKCDLRGGEGADSRCTGNLFLQTHEINPLKMY